MNGGVKATLLVSCISLAGCVTETKQVQFRPIADPAAALTRGGNLTALARGELLIGNVGLALEGFRKAQRAYPTEAAPLAGIGDCYAAMGRFDIAQSSYESALALAPNDRRLLLALADIFDHEGQPLKAMAARADAARAAPVNPPATAVATARITPTAAAVAVTRPPQVAPMPSPRVTPATAAIAKPAAPMPTLAKVAAAAPPLAAPVPTAEVRSTVARAAPLAAAPAATRESHPTIALAAPVMPTATPAVARIESVAPSAPPAVKAAQPAPAQVAEAEIPMHVSAGSITVELPPARPVAHVEVHVSAPPLPPIEEPRVLASSVTVPLPPARPAPAKRPVPTDDPPVAVVQAYGPRLERLSRGEVALVTTGKPIWNTQVQPRMASASSGVRWAALQPSPGARPNIQVLNAARTHGIAGSARTVLLNRGWRRIDVGDAPSTREKSVVLYSRNRAKLGKSLAAQFGVAARMVERDVLVLVLGRDSVDRVTGQQKS